MSYSVQFEGEFKFPNEKFALKALKEIELEEENPDTEETNVLCKEHFEHEDRLISINFKNWMSSLNWYGCLRLLSKMSTYAIHGKIKCNFEEDQEEWINAGDGWNMQVDLLEMLIAEALTKTENNSLDEIETIYAPHRKIKDISALKKIKNATWIFLYDNQIKDINALNGMSKLKRLNLGYNKFEDLTPLKNLSSLQELSIRGIPVSDQSLIPLATLTNLTKLEVSTSDETKRIHSMEWVKKLKSLQHISIPHSNVQDLHGIETLDKLIRISFEDNDIQHVGPLSKLTYIESINLKKNKVVDLMPLSNLKTLRLLIIAENNQLNTLNGIQELENLERLDFSSTSVDNLAPLGDLIDRNSALKEVHMKDNPYLDLSKNSKDRIIYDKLKARGVKISANLGKALKR